MVAVTDSAGQVLPVAGSGILEITPSGVASGAIESFSIKYRAETALTNAYLVIQLPANDGADGLVAPKGETAITLQEAESDDPYYLSKTNLPGAAEQVLGNNADSNIIVWGPLKGKVSFTRTLQRATVSDTANAYSWVAALVEIGEDETAPNGASVPAAGRITGQSLYVLEVDDPQVTFRAESVDGSGTNPIKFIAGSVAEITFTFEAVAQTFFKDGQVSFELPNDWPKPTKDDGSETSAKVTATLPDGSIGDADTDGDRDVVPDADISFNGNEIIVKVSALGSYY